MIETKSYGYTADFDGTEKAILIELKKHIRSYQRNFLKDEDYPTPKVWSDKKIITFPSWNRNHVDNSIIYAFDKMGPKFKRPKYEIRAAEKEESRYYEEEEIQNEKQRTISFFGFEPRVPAASAQEEGFANSSSGKYRLLITPDVRDALSDVETKKRPKIIDFIKGLINGTWEQWVEKGEGVDIWQQKDSGVYLFTKVVEGFGLAVWESMLAVDIISTIYSYNSDKPQYSDASRFTPYIVLHEFRKMEEKLGDVLSFQGRFYNCVKENSQSLILEDKPITDIDGMELYQFSPSRISDLISGEDIALPLHLTVTQLEPLISSGPILLGGEAGSGKSSVIILWLTINHIRNYSNIPDSAGGPKQLFVTYSSRLRDKARQDFEQMLPRNYRNHRTEFRTFKELLEEICIRSGKIGLFPEEKEVKFEHFVRKFAKNLDRGVDAVLLWDEIRGTIKGGSIEDPSKFLDLSTYQNLSEKKGKSKVPQKLREIYYSGAQAYQAYLQKEGLWDQLDMVSTSIANINFQGIERYDRIACDEVQDLAPKEIFLLLQLLEKGYVNNIFFTGDEAQVINPSGFRWSRLKGDLGNLVVPWPIPEVITFRQNYRSSSQIVDMVNAVLEVRRSLLDDNVSRVKQKSKISSKVSPMVLLEDPVKVLRETDTNPDKRLVLVKTQDQKSRLLNELGNASENVSVLTVEEAKGLEWDGVLLYNFFIPRNEVLTSNDWNDAFDPHRRELLKQELQSGSRSPYGLTYEFNLLHVGITRARSFLAIFDKDPKMQLKKLGDPIIPTVSDGGSESFSGYWETKVATADDYRRLGFRLIDHDTEQAHRFFILSAGIYLSEGNFKAAAECYEYGMKYDEAAKCYQQIEDKQNELRLLSKDFELKGNLEQAGDKMLQLSEIAREERKPYSISIDACDEASRLYGSARMWDKQSKALESKARAFPLDKHAERTDALNEAAKVVCQRTANHDGCIRLTRNAIKELESAGLIEGSRFGGYPVSAWIADRKSHIAEELEKINDPKGAAKEAESSYKLYLSAADSEKSTSSSKEGFYERSANECAKCIDYSLDSGDLDLAKRARRDLASIVKHRDNVEQIRRWWNAWIARYLQINDFEQYAESSVELATILADKKLYSEALPLLKESYRQNADKLPQKISLNLLNELVRLSYISQPIEEYHTALNLRGTLLKNTGDYAKAFEDFRTSGELLAHKGNIPGSRESFTQALSCAEFFMQGVAIGKYCLYDVGINTYAVGNMTRIAFEWIEKSSKYFVQDIQKAKSELISLVDKFKDQPEGRLVRGWIFYGQALFYYELSKSGVPGDNYQNAESAAQEAVKTLESLSPQNAKDMRERISTWMK